MLNFKSSLLLILHLNICGFCTHINAQSKVESFSYNTLLSTLLSHSVKEINVKEVSKNRDVVILDSRTKNEFDISHIPTAQWVGYEEFNIENLPAHFKDSAIIVYCSVGYRSEKIAEKLKKQGFKNVSNLYGGIFEWKNQGYSVVDSTNKSTERVHAYDKFWGIWLTKGEKIYE